MNHFPSRPLFYLCPGVCLNAAEAASPASAIHNIMRTECYIGSFKIILEQRPVIRGSFLSFLRKVFAGEKEAGSEEEFDGDFRINRIGRALSFQLFNPINPKIPVKKSSLVTGKRSSDPARPSLRRVGPPGSSPERRVAHRDQNQPTWRSRAWRRRKRRASLCSPSLLARS